MAELSYVTHLNIPVKYRGTILHAYEYNATVNKINEIVDHLHTTYEYNASFPRFDVFDDIFASTSEGKAVIIHNNTGKLYPVTSSAYVLVDTHKTLDDELQYLNSYITTGLDDVYEKITYTQSLIEGCREYSTQLTNELSNDVDLRFMDLRNYIDGLNSYVNGLINGLETTHNTDIENVNSYISSEINSLKGYVDDINSYLSELYSTLSTTHDTDIETVNTYISTEITNVYDEIAYVKDLINKYHSYSYSYSYDSLEEFSIYVNNRFNSIQSYIDGTYSYVINLYNDLNTTHGTDIENVNTYISSEITNVYDEITYVKDLINKYHSYSYSYSCDSIEELTNYVNERFDNVQSYIDGSYSYVVNLYNNISNSLDNLSNYVDSKFDELKDYTDDVESYLVGLYNDLSATHNSGIEEVNTYISSEISNVYNKISYTNQLIDDYYTYSYAYSYSLTHNLSNDVDTKLTDLRSYVNELNEYLTNAITELAELHAIDIENILSYIPSYIAGFGISIDDTNTVSVNTADIVDNRSIYVNSYGQLVVNNEVVLYDAEKSFKFIDEHGNWVGDMANVKNYIDNSISTLENELSERITYNTNEITYLRGDMNTEVNNMYTYVTKFAEYDTYGKNYILSEEFIQSQE